MTHDWTIGDRIKGRYEVLDVRLGGFSTVYICHDHEFSTNVAVKALKAELTENPEIASRFTREAEAWMRMESHPNVVWAKWVDVVNKRPLIFLEYVEGASPTEPDMSALVKRGPTEPIEALRLLVGICTGLQYAIDCFAKRRRVFVHRDIKPQNVMLDRELTPKLTDFGLVKLYADLSKSKAVDETVSIMQGRDDGDTRLGQVFGTPVYMSPEQWTDASRVDARSDIYSLGCVTYELLNGHPPFRGRDLGAVRRQHLEAPPPRPSRAEVEIPGRLEDLVARCLAKNPGDRFQRVDELRAEACDIAATIFRTELAYQDTASDVGIAALSNIAMSLENLGRSREAIEYHDRLIVRVLDELSPEMVARAINNRGNAYNSLGERQKAIANYRLAKRLDERYDFPWYNTSGVRIAEGDYHAALVEVERSIEINPDYSSAHSRRARILATLGRPEEALEACERALSLEPREVEARQLRDRLRSRRKSDRDENPARRAEHGADAREHSESAGAPPLLDADSTTTEGLGRVLDGAFVDWSPAPGSGLFVEDGYRFLVTLLSPRLGGQARIFIVFGFREDVAEAERVSFANRLNEGYRGFRAAHSEGNLVMDDHLDLRGGVSERAFVLWVKRFAGSVKAVLKQEGERILR